MANFPMDELNDLWKGLSDVPIDSEECINISWSIFPKGTHREDIWHWFEEQNENFIVAEHMYGMKCAQCGAVISMERKEAKQPKEGNACGECGDFVCHKCTDFKNSCTEKYHGFVCNKCTVQIDWTEA